MSSNVGVSIGCSSIPRCIWNLNVLGRVHKSLSQASALSLMTSIPQANILLSWSSSVCPPFTFSNNCTFTQTLVRRIRPADLNILPFNRPNYIKWKIQIIKPPSTCYFCLCPRWCCGQPVQTGMILALRVLVKIRSTTFDETCSTVGEMQQLDRRAGYNVSVVSEPEACQPCKHSGNYTYHML